MATCSDQRSVYLITYSRADLMIVSTREEFADIWVKAFGEDVVKQWACCCEKNKESDEVHFHLALKLKKVKRWKMATRIVVDKNYAKILIKPLTPAATTPVHPAIVPQYFKRCSSITRIVIFGVNGQSY